jgi:hypothetical protein
MLVAFSNSIHQITARWLRSDLQVLVNEYQWHDWVCIRPRAESTTEHGDIDIGNPFHEELLRAFSTRGRGVDRPERFLENL